MSDPLSPSFMMKVVAGIGGLVGGVAFMAFYRPKNVWDAAIRSGVSTAAAIIGSMPILDWLGYPMTTNNLIAISAMIGFCSWSVLSLLARFLIDIQDERVRISLPKYITIDRKKKKQ